MHNYKRKTNHGKVPKDIMERAVHAVLIKKSHVGQLLKSLKSHM